MFFPSTSHPADRQGDIRFSSGISRSSFLDVRKVMDTIRPAGNGAAVPGIVGRETYELQK